MKDILTVFRFTLRDGARKKAFWVTTIIVLVLIVEWISTKIRVKLARG